MKPVRIVLVIAALGAIAWIALRERPSAEAAPETQQPAAHAPAAQAPGAHAPAAAQTAAADTPSKLPGAARLGAGAELGSAVAHLDPKRSGWTTEDSSSRALGALKKLGKAAAHAGRECQKEVEALAAPEFVSTALRPADLRSVREDASLRVRRGRGARGPESEIHRGSAGLSSAVAEWVSPFTVDSDLVLEFKSIRVAEQPDGFEMLARAQLSGPGREGRVMTTAWWRTKWRFEPEGATRLLRIALEDYTEAIGPAGGATLFADATAAVLSGAPEAARQLATSSDVWASGYDRRLGLSFLGHEGLSVADVDGDGREDVYVCQGGGIPNRLLLQQADGSVRDAGAEWGLDVLDLSRSALFVDLDGDDDLDLALAGEGVTFFERQERGFRRAARHATGTVTSLAAADVDADGDLDLYAACYASPESTMPKPYHDANNGPPNALLRNEGGWSFVDATRELGLDENNRRFSFACAFGDVDGDGDPDLAVASDFGRKNLYLNEGGRFRDVAPERGVEDLGAGMSTAFGDADRDGQLDLYFGNMFSSAGNRVAFQTRFQPEADERARAGLQRHARGNALFLNRGARGFEDVSETAGVHVARWAWSSNFADVDDDGLEDLLVANGYISNQDPDDL